MDWLQWVRRQISQGLDKEVIFPTNKSIVILQSDTVELSVLSILNVWPIVFILVSLFAVQQPSCRTQIYEGPVFHMKNELNSTSKNIENVYYNVINSSYIHNNDKPISIYT